MVLILISLYLCFVTSMKSKLIKNLHYYIIINIITLLLLFIFSINSRVEDITEVSWLHISKINLCSPYAASKKWTELTKIHKLLEGKSFREQVVSLWEAYKDSDN